MNDPQPLVEINVRAPRYFIARTRRDCRHCKEQTELFALALPSDHETLDVDEGVENASPGDANRADAWILAKDPALIFHVEFMSPEAAARLALLTRSFRIDQRDSAAEPSWTNHCEACGSPFDDEELFCEPGEAFFPTSEAGAAAIRLLPIEEPLEAAAGGYSFDPNFFHDMSLE
jgi:hypothetical protein